jgi:hypothetical protein
MKVLLERDIERYLVKRAKALGGEVRKVKWIGRDGAPDRLVMLPSRREPTDKHFPIIAPMSVWVEVKRPGGLATFPKNAHERKQVREHQRMRKAGQHIAVIDSFEGVDVLLA